MWDSGRRRCRPCRPSGLTMLLQVPTRWRPHRAGVPAIPATGACSNQLPSGGLVERRRRPPAAANPKPTGRPAPPGRVKRHLCSTPTRMPVPNRGKGASPGALQVLPPLLGPPRRCLPGLARACCKLWAARERPTRCGPTRAAAYVAIPWVPVAGPSTRNTQSSHMTHEGWVGKPPVAVAFTQPAMQTVLAVRAPRVAAQPPRVPATLAPPGVAARACAARAAPRLTGSPVPPRCDRRPSLSWPPGPRSAAPPPAGACAW